MKDIIIVGAGGFGREAYYLIQEINAVRPRWNVKGFLTDIPMDLKSKKINCPILGSIKDWVPQEDEVFALGISSPAGKEKVVGILKARGAQFETLVSPRAVCCSTAEIGEGSVVTALSSINDCARIGRFVHIAGSMIGQDVEIGDYSTTTGYSNIACSRLGKRVFVGSHAVVLNKLTVGDGAVVGACSCVIRNVKEGATVFGNPAERIDQ